MKPNHNPRLLILSILAAFLLAASLQAFTFAHGREATGTVTIEIERGTGGGSGGGAGDRDRTNPRRPTHRDILLPTGPGPDAVTILPEDRPTEEILGALPTTGSKRAAWLALAVGTAATAGGVVLLRHNRMRITLSLEGGVWQINKHPTKGDSK